MNSLVLLLMTSCLPASDPVWVDAPAGPSYSSWGDGGGWQSAPPREGRHRFFQSRKGLFHRKQQAGGCPYQGGSPVQGYGMGMPETMNGSFVPGPATANGPFVPGPATAGLPQRSCNCQQPGALPPQEVGMTAPPMRPVPAIPTSLPRIVPQPIAPPISTGPPPLASEPSIPRPAPNMAKPMPRGEPAPKEPF